MYRQRTFDVTLYAKKAFRIYRARETLRILTFVRLVDAVRFRFNWFRFVIVVLINYGFCSSNTCWTSPKRHSVKRMRCCDLPPCDRLNEQHELLLVRLFRDLLGVLKQKAQSQIRCIVKIVQWQIGVRTETRPLNSRNDEFTFEVRG